MQYKVKAWQPTCFYASSSIQMVIWANILAYVDVAFARTDVYKKPTEQLGALSELVFYKRSGPE